MNTPRWIKPVCIVALVLLYGHITRAAAPAADNAGNYTPITFTNGSNGGSGFGPWQFNVGASAFVDLVNSATNSGNINSTNDLSFRFLGGTNTSYGEAIRDFNAPLAAGDQFGLTIAYNYNGGNRGVNLLNASGAELLNVNYGGADTLSLQFAGSGGVALTTDYISTATVSIVVQQLSGNRLDVTLTRNDGFTTNLVSNPLSSPAAKVKFYNGGHAGDTADYALFVNNLFITPSALDAINLDGHDAMAAGMTNAMRISRSGNLDPLTVTLTSSDPQAASVPASVSFDAGTTETNFLITGTGLGPVTVTASASGYPDATLDIHVYDLGYDDTSYYPPGIFEDVGNGGLGFQSWIIQNNNGSGEAFTNYAGAFIGNAVSGGGGDVNVSGSAFGLYANGDGPGNPFVNAIRQLDAPLQVGQAFSVEFGVNFRNGSKGVAVQNGGYQVFEIGVYADDYFYKTGNGAPVSLGWDYASDSAIMLEVKRVSLDWYDITVLRKGSAPETNALGLVELDSVPNEVRFFNYDTEGGDQNNLYFNRLAVYSSEVIATLSIAGNDGKVAGQTNPFTVTRTGPTNDALTVDLASTAPGVASVAASVEIPAGQLSATFSVNALSNGLTQISAESAGFIGDLFDVEVFDIAYDDTTYYGPGSFTNESNGGSGFEPWAFTDNNGVGEGYTNYVGFFTGNSLDGGSDVNASDDNAFALYANGEGTGGPDPLIEARRPFNALGIGESISVDIGVNFRNGAKGVMFQSAEAWLFEVAVFGDEYWYNVRENGDNPVSLGWSYAADSAIRVTLSRTGATSYNARLERFGSSPDELLVENIILSQAPDRLRFYVFNTDNGDASNNLYINRLAIYTGTVGAASTDGIPNSWWEQYGIDPIDRIAAVDLDGDGETSGNEYIADTHPDDIASVFTNMIISASGSDVLSLQMGPTTNSRVYDIWWSTNLLAAPQQWNRLGVTTAGNGGMLILDVTNDAPSRAYRTGVALP